MVIEIFFSDITRLNQMIMYSIFVQYSKSSFWGMFFLGVKSRRSPKTGAGGFCLVWGQFWIFCLGSTIYAEHKERNSMNLRRITMNRENRNSNF